MASGKIGLITYHRTSNFGSALQTYALGKTLENMGYSCEVIDYRNDVIEAREFSFSLLKSKSLGQLKDRIKYGRFRKRKAEGVNRFISEKMHLSALAYDKSNKSSIEKYDTILVGSDLVWDFTINGHDTTYMLDFAPDSTKKIAYASSCGQLWQGDDVALVKGLLGRFDAIGVREKAIETELKGMLSTDIQFVCDPTMLLTSDEWKSMLKGRVIEGDYVLVYMCDAEKQIYRDAIEYGKKNNMPVYLISSGWYPEGMNVIRPNHMEEFLSLIYHADTIFSASYHGMLFSIYFHKNFFYYNRGWKERMISISDYLNLAEREHWYKDKSYEQIDYTAIDEKIEEFRNSSLHFLEKKL